MSFARFGPTPMMSATALGSNVHVTGPRVPDSDGGGETKWEIIPIFREQTRRKFGKNQAYQKMKGNNYPHRMTKVNGSPRHVVLGKNRRAPHHVVVRRTNTNKNARKMGQNPCPNVLQENSSHGSPCGHHEKVSKRKDGSDGFRNVFQCKTPTRKPKENTGRNPGKLLGCDTLSFAAACKRGKNFKEEARCAEVHSHAGCSPRPL